MQENTPFTLLDRGEVTRRYSSSLVSCNILALRIFARMQTAIQSSETVLSMACFTLFALVTSIGTKARLLIEHREFLHGRFVRCTREICHDAGCAFFRGFNG